MPRASGEPRHSRTEFPIIPLVNIVLLLLVAVMLTATLHGPEPFEVQRGVAGHAAVGDPNTPTILIDPDGRLARAGAVVSLEAFLDELRRAPTDTIRLEADQQTRAGDVLRVRDALFGVGVQRVELLVDTR
jgi:biopolymer transport protein ExbD